ncbi:MAG: NAD(P)H-dependent oxidoreductase [bacterium]
MAVLLHIQASPRERSHSKAVADIFLEAYQKINPQDSVRSMDLFKLELPAFDGLVLQAKYNILHGQAHSPQELEAWSKVERLIEDFKSADKYVWSLPMWNFGIPYRLKHYLDILVQPGYTFSYSPQEGYRGLVCGKPAILICARGGAYGSPAGASSMDFQLPYMELILGFMGFQNTRKILIEPTLQGGPEAAQKARQQAIELARHMAMEF